MKNTVHKIIAIFLTSILLISTTSFGINQHVCGGSIYSTSVFGEAEDCGMEMESCEDENIGFCTLSNDESCCNDVNIIVEGATLIKVKEIKAEVNTLFLAAFIITSQNLYQSVNKTSKKYNNYIPPLIDKDINVLYEVFLI